VPATGKVSINTTTSQVQSPERQNSRTVPSAVLTDKPPMLGDIMRPDAAGRFWKFVASMSQRHSFCPSAARRSRTREPWQIHVPGYLAADMKDYVGRESPLYSRQATFRVLPSRGRVHAPHLPQTRGPEPHGCTQDQQLFYESFSACEWARSESSLRRRSARSRNGDRALDLALSASSTWVPRIWSASR
jgi:hypothetical protein